MTVIGRVIAFLCVLLNAPLSQSVECEIYMRYIENYGVGIYAGRLYERNRDIENSIGIPIPYQVIINTELINYMEGLNDTHGLLLLGYASMLNSVVNPDNSMVRKHVSFMDSQMKFAKNIGESYDIVTEPIGLISPGNQIFTYYGDTWFTDRGVTPVDSNTLSNRDQIVHIQDLNDVTGILPGCVDYYTEYKHVEISKAKLKLIDDVKGSNADRQSHHTNVNGVQTTIDTESLQSPSTPQSTLHHSTQYAKRLVAAVDIPKDMIIETSRVLLIPDSKMLRNVSMSGALATLAWFPSRVYNENTRFPSRVYNENTSRNCRRENTGDTTNISMNDTCEYVDSTGSGSHTNDKVSKHSVQYTSPYYVPPYSKDTDYALVLLGRGMLYSTIDRCDDTVVEHQYNIQYSWYDVSDVLNTDTTHTFNSNSANKDIDSTTSLIAFSAIRDIVKGEELSIPLCEDSVSGNRYVHSRFWQW